jgi:mannonate dehydratase
MKLGCQSGPTSDAHFAYFARYGVEAISAAALIEGGRTYPTVAELSRLREMSEKHGLSLDLLTPPILPSSHTDRERNPSIMRAQSPQRDRDIEAFQMTLRNCAAVGIPAVKYNMSILGVLRTDARQGGGTAHTAPGGSRRPSRRRR